MELRDTLKFGKHTMEVVSINASIYDDNDRYISMICTDECCQENKVCITMQEGELKALADVYTDSIKTIEMKCKLTDTLRTIKDKIKNTSECTITIEEEVVVPWSTVSRFTKRYSNILGEHETNRNYFMND